MMRNPRWCNFIGLMLGTFALAPILIMLLDRREPVELISGAITPYQARVNQQVLATWSVREHRSCDGMVWQFFVDQSGIIHSLEPAPTVYHAGRGERTFAKLLTVPQGMAPGEAVYDSKIERWCNPLQRVFWPIKSDGLRIPFVVIGD